MLRFGLICLSFSMSLPAFAQDQMVDVKITIRP